MQLNKPSGLDAGKTTELPVKNASSIAERVSPLSKTHATAQVKTLADQSARSITSLITASGLPQDRLSVSILSLARFFSLSLKPEQLAAIRRQAFAQQQSAPQQTGSPAAQTAPATPAAQQTAQSIAQVREAFSLAAAAAESKGVELQPKGLESYAEAVDPDQNKRQDSGRQDTERRHKEQHESEDKDGINAVSIKKIALESAENNPVLSIMNKLPGKNGQRWIVLPFDFCQNEKNFRVSMRVLLEGDNAIFTALDILTMRNEQLAVSNEKRQSFALEFTNNKVSRLTYYDSENPAANKNLIKKELAGLFEIPLENVLIKTDYSFQETDYGEKLLRFIDEAV